MQKSSVKTLSIIDTLSELVQDAGAATQLAQPASATRPRPPYQRPDSQQPPQLKPRSPKVNVGMPTAVRGATPHLSPQAGIANGHAPTAAPAPTQGQSPGDGVLLIRRKKKKLPSYPSPNPAGTSPGVVSPHGQVMSPKGGGQTPDWIRDIFLHAKRGLTDKLSVSLSGLDPTLIRNLTDHQSNNLLHTVCSLGHLGVLPWLVRRMGGPQTGPAGALDDENRKGMTPVQAAIKFGHVQCVQWLLRHVPHLRQRLASSDTDRHRTWLHWAAKYGQDSICSWLCEEMAKEDVHIDQIDSAGSTPLHLAAREGKLATISVLLGNGANVQAKNDMGMKAVDCALWHSHRDCAEFLLVFETSQGVATDLLQVTAKQEKKEAENNEIKSLFKDVLSIAKKLARERDEMCRELGRLYETMLELHNNMTMEIQVLSTENAALLRKTHSNSSSPIQDGAGSPNDESANIKACTSLHEKWQAQQRQWFSTSLVDSETRLMRLEDGWKRVAKSLPGAHSPQLEPSYAHRHLRDRIEETRSKMVIKQGAPPPSTTDSSDSSCDESLPTAEDSAEAAAMRRLRRSIAQRKKLATPSPPKAKNEDGPLADLEESNSVYSSLSNEMYSKIASPQESTAQLAAPPIRNSQLNSSIDSEGRRRSREALKMKLREFALTSESGSASVIEVIEPTSSEEEEFRRSLHEMNLSWAQGIATPQSSPKKASNTPLRSPTQRLLEMGISPVTLDTHQQQQVGPDDHHPKPRQSTPQRAGDSLPVEESGEEGAASKGSGSNLFQKWASKTQKWSKIKRGVRKEPAGREATDGDPMSAEEHVLPDTFEDDDSEVPTTSSPSHIASVASRKALFSAKPATVVPDPHPGGSVSTSEDSGIALIPHATNVIAKLPPLPNDPEPGSPKRPIINNNNNNNKSDHFKLGKIEEASMTSPHARPSNAALPDASERIIHHALPTAALSPANMLLKKKMESKAWYDVPSEDEKEPLEEDDDENATGVDDEEEISLASIISNRASSDED